MLKNVLNILHFSVRGLPSHACGMMISFIRLSYYPELASNTIGMHFPFFFIKQCKKVWRITKKRCTFNPKIT